MLAYPETFGAPYRFAGDVAPFHIWAGLFVATSAIAIAALTSIRPVAAISAASSHTPSSTSSSRSRSRR
ncbi:MAG: hypothetical protein R2695_04185 [Acidimicrobiales bacterium]